MTAITKEHSTTTQRQLYVALELGWTKWNVGIHASAAPFDSAPGLALKQSPSRRRPRQPLAQKQPPRPLRLWRQINGVQTRKIETQVHLKIVGSLPNDPILTNINPSHSGWLEVPHDTVQSPPPGVARIE